MFANLWSTLKVSEYQGSIDHEEMTSRKGACKIDKTVPRTVMGILSTERIPNAFEKNKKQNFSENSKSNNAKRYGYSTSKH